VWSYHDNVELLLSSNVSGDGFITNLEVKWNLIGYPYNTSIPKENLIINYDGVDYTWFEATSQPDPIILGYIYGWSQSSQYYIISEKLEPTCGYWIYSYYQCTLKKSN